MLQNLTGALFVIFVHISLVLVMVLVMVARNHVIDAGTAVSCKSQGNSLLSFCVYIFVWFVVCVYHPCRYVEKAQALIKTAMKACDNGPPVPPQQLEDDMKYEIQVRMVCTDACTYACTTMIDNLSQLPSR